MQELEATTQVDKEILGFIESHTPAWQELAGTSDTFNKALTGLLALDPDQVLSMYLEDSLDTWMRETISKLNNWQANSLHNGKAKRDTLPDPVLPPVLPKTKPADITPDPSGGKNQDEPITIEVVRKYISTRYGRLREYAEYHAGLVKMSEEGTDVLNEVLLSILLKPEQKLIDMFSRKKQGYTELDFFILKMIKLSCHSSTSPYQWRYHNKNLKHDENSETIGLNNKSEWGENDSGDFQEFEPEIIAEVQEDTEIFEEDYSEQEEPAYPEELICARFQLLRGILEKLPITNLERRIFKHHFFCEEPWGSWRGKEKVKQLQIIFRKVKSLVIEVIQRKKEEHALQVIHKLFNQAKRISIPITEPDFLLLRVFLSEKKSSIEKQIEQAETLKDPELTETLQSEDEIKLREQLKVLSLFEKRVLFIFSDRLEAFRIKNQF